MNRARQKGSHWEVELLERLRLLWGPTIHRAPLRGSQDAGDFVNTPFLCEAKSTQRPLLMEWARQAEGKADRWAIFWHGDRRKSGAGPYVICPLSLFEELVEHHLPEVA